MRRLKIPKIKRTLSRPIFKVLTHTLIIMFLGIVISNYLVYSPFNLAFISPLEKSVDLQMSDIYHAIASQRPVSTVNTDIVIVNIDQCQDREEIAHVLDFLDTCNPKLIGLDIFFERSLNESSDNKLITSILTSNNIVTPLIMMKYDGQTEQFKVQKDLFFHQILEEDSKRGAINLNGDLGKQSMIRDFSKYFIIDKDSVATFSVKIAQAINHDGYKKLMLRPGNIELINYKHQDFITLEVDELAEGGELLKDKIILVGSLSLSDRHHTPICADMNGIYIHAYILSTIMNEDYITKVGSKTDLYITSILYFCFIFFWIWMRTFNKFSNGTDAIMRFVQLGMIIACLYFGYYVFFHYNSSWNYVSLLLLLGLSSLIIDLYFGGVELLFYLYRKMCTLVKKLRT